jgi:hypothetical protein
MPQRIEIPLGMRQEKARSKFVSSQSLVNCAVEQLPDSGMSIYGGPGLDEFAEVGDGPIRGTDHFNETLLAVSGNMLYSVDENGTETEIGPIPGYDPVIIANNGTQAVIQSDATSYVLNSDLTTLSPLNDTDFQRSTSVAFLKQVIISTVFGTSRFQTSNLANASSYDALDIATAEAKPDNLRRVIVSGQEALMMGLRSVEGYYFSGKADGVPLSPTQTYLEYGLAGRMAVTGIDNTIAWLSHLLDVRTLRDQSPLAIADPAITSMIQGWTNPDTAKAFTFAVGGHEWMAIHHAQGCAIWDATTRLWSMRQSQNSNTWKVDSSTWCYNKNIMGDRSEGKLWALNPNTHKEGSDALIRSIVTRTLGPGGSPFTLEAVELECEVGVGLASGQGSDPKVWMQLSRDSGETWGARMERSIGAMGNRNLRVIWGGPFGDFLPHGGVIRFGCSDPVRFVATKAFAEITVNQA